MKVREIVVRRPGFAQRQIIFAWCRSPNLRFAVAARIGEILRLSNTHTPPTPTIQTLLLRRYVDPHGETLPARHLPRYPCVHWNARTMNMA